MQIATAKPTSEEPERIFWHWQNLTQDDDRFEQERFPWNGRAWLHLRRRRCIGLEWNIKNRFRAGISFAAGTGDMDDGWSFHFGFWPIDLHLSFEGFGLPAPKEWSLALTEYRAKQGCHDPDGWVNIEKEFQITLVNFGDGDPSIHWSIWAKTMEWHRGDPWWATTHVINLKDLLLGQPKFTKEELKTIPVKIPMEEASYDGIATLERCTWKRPRWPWPKQRLSWYLNIPKGIPHPGKGTAAYNCGDDALFGIGSDSRNGHDVEVVVAKAIESVLQSRRRYPL